MAKESTIQHYSSSTTGNTPSAVDLASGELAINIADEKVFLKNLLGNVVSLSQSKDLSGAFASKATVVTSFNGATGAVTGATLGANTFTALNTFNAGISSSGITGTLPSIMSSNSSGQLIITAKSSIASTPDNAVITLVGGDSDFSDPNDPILPSITLTAKQINLGYDGNVSQINLGSASVNSSKLAYSVNGVTGPIQITASTGIAIGSTGKTLTITNKGVQSFNGATGAVTGASLGANTFTALNSFNAGISASALTVSGTITSTEGITFGSGTTFMAFVPKTASNGGGVWLRDGLFQVGGAVLAANNGSLQYNMNSERFYVYGNQIIDNAAPYQGTTTPLTVKGGTGQSVPLFNVTRGGTSAVQVHQDGYLAIPVNTSPAIKIGNHDSKNLTLASIEGSGEIVETGGSNSGLNIRQESGGPVSIGDYNGTLNSNYISVSDVDSVIDINGVEIYLNGTIVTPIVLGNAESIQNTVNGRIDFMPGPTAAGAYGLYADVANWGYGVQMGTINSAGTIDSSPGGILFMDRVTFLQDKFIGFASDGTHGLVYTTQGLNTLQIGVYPGVANSNAVAIVGTDFTGTTNRSPVTSHTNPNLYVYRAGTTSANDFIRIEHDGTNGNIVAGGTSGIKISGLLDVASGLSAAGATFSGNISAPNIANSVNGLTGSVKIPRSLSVYAPTTSDSITLFYTPVALTISRISAVLRGSSTPSVTYNLNYGTDRSSGTLVFTSGTTVTSTTTATVVTSFNNSSIPAGGFLWLTASAVSGTVDELSVSVEF